MRALANWAQAGLMRPGRVMASLVRLRLRLGPGEGAGRVRRAIWPTSIPRVAVPLLPSWGSQPSVPISCPGTTLPG